MYSPIENKLYFFFLSRKKKLLSRAQLFQANWHPRTSKHSVNLQKPTNIKVHSVVPPSIMVWQVSQEHLACWCVNSLFFSLGREIIVSLQLFFFFSIIFPLFSKLCWFKELHLTCTWEQDCFYLLCLESTGRLSLCN